MTATNFLLLVPLGALLAGPPGCAAEQLAEDPPPSTAVVGESPGPTSFEKQGRLVCLAEEMRDHFNARVPPVHDHILAFRVDGDVPTGEPRYYLILRTHFAKALFEDRRYEKETLVLSGRLYPGSSALDVTRFRWVKDGRVEELYYWCEVCAIKTVDPDRCACCQADVEFRTRAVSGGGR